MSFADWYVALFCLAAGTGIPAYWVTPKGRAALAMKGPQIRFHLVAELLTCAVLLAGGAGILAADDAKWVTLTAALGLGMLFYTLTGSPGYYLERGDKQTARLLLLTWLGAIPAVTLLFTR